MSSPARRPRSGADRVDDAVSRAGRPLRRDVNLTAVVVTVVICMTLMVYAWLAVAADQSHQGLDVRPMLTIPLGPQQWGEVFAWLTAAAAYWKASRRSHRTERAARAELPAALDQQRQAVAAELAALRAVLRQALATIDAQAAQNAAEAAAVRADVAALREVLATPAGGRRARPSEPAPAPDVDDVADQPRPERVRADFDRGMAGVVLRPPGAPWPLRPPCPPPPAAHEQATPREVARAAADADWHRLLYGRPAPEEEP